MNVYISSSWKNREAVRGLAVDLRNRGHIVYDFTDPSCRQMPEIPPERFPEQFDPEKHLYSEYIESVREWRDAVNCNRRALDQCDMVILLLPCGTDAHADWAYGVGLGKRSIVVGQPKAGDRTPTHLWSDAIIDSVPEAIKYLRLAYAEPKEPLTAKSGAEFFDSVEKTAKRVDQWPEWKKDTSSKTAEPKEGSDA